MTKKLLAILVVLILLILVGYAIPRSAPTTFAECVEVGGLVLGSPPEWCAFGGSTYAHPGYQPVTPTPEVEPRAEVTPSTPSVDMADWQTYRNEEYGFEFKYPQYLGEIGEFSKNSVLGTYDEPVPGLFIGEWVLVIANNQEIIDSAKSTFFRFYNHQESELVRCVRRSVDNPLVLYVSCNGEGGGANYALIQKADNSQPLIFVDGYSNGWGEPIEIHLKKEEEIFQILSTFRFID